MENLKIFFISIFTCTSRKKSERKLREKQQILRYYVDNKKRKKYHTFSKFTNDGNSDNLPPEVFID